MLGGASTSTDNRRTHPPVVLWAALLVLLSWPAFTFALGDWLAREGLMLPGGRTWFGRDFTNLYLGGEMLRERVPIYDFRTYIGELQERGITAGQNSSYPPPVYLVGVPLSYLPYGVALALWHLVGAALFVFAARKHIPFHWGWLFLFPAMVSIPNGQYGLYTAAFWMFAFAGSGVAAGVLTIKPHLGILLALAMAVKTRIRMIIVALAVAIGLLLLAELAFGLTAAFLGEGREMQMRILLTEADMGYFGAMPSTYVLLRGSPLAWPAQIAVGIAAVVMVWPLLVRADFKRLVFPLATATFLILPYSFSYDMAVVGLGFASLLWREWRVLSLLEKVVTALALLSTQWLFATPLFLLAGLYVQRRRLLLELGDGEAQEATP